METSYVLSSNRVMQESEWTKEQNKWFESALAIFDTETPDRWSNVAALVPGKSEYDVKKQYEELKADINDIEADLVPVPSYFTSPFKLELVEDRDFNSFGKRPLKSRSFDQERRKGVPWTEEEHRRFLMGLQVHGRGDWRNISRNFVMTKTPTQVASHAQKYYARQHADGKEKRRPSIHDITMVHLPDNNAFSSEDTDKSSLSINKPVSSLLRQKPTPFPHNLLHNPGDGTLMVSDSTRGNSVYPFEIGKMNGINIRVYNSGLHFHPSMYQVQG